MAMRPSLRVLRLPARANTRRNIAGAIVAGAVALAGVTGCGSTNGGPSSSPTGVLAGKVTFGGANGAALVRAFDASGRLVAHQNVSDKHRRFRFVVTPGRYQVLLRMVTRPGGHLPGCARTYASVQVNHTTHVVLGQSCSSAS